MASEETRVAFGKALRRLRTSMGLSQEALAEAAGRHPNYIIRLERGSSSPSLATIEAIARALSMRPSELLRAAEDEAATPHD